MTEEKDSKHTCPYENTTIEQCVLDDRRKKDEVHVRHHVWIQEQIEQGRARRRMYNTITKIVLQWSIPVVSGAIFYWFKSHVTF